MPHRHRLSLLGRSLRLSFGLSLSLVAITPLTAQATVLPFFQTYGTGGLAAYGDRVTAPSQAGATYTQGAGWTPNVQLDFTTLNTAGPPSLYPAGYAALSYAFGHTNFDVPYRIDFVPDAGFQVTLRSFDIATWSSGTYATDIRIWDDNGSFAQPNLYAFSSSLGPQVVYQPLTAPVTGSGTVRLYLNNLGSTGLDNIDFVQSPVPEPATVLLMALGVAGLLARRNAR